MKKGLKSFIDKISKDKEFSKKYEGKSAKEVSKLAAEDGFSFTAEEFMDLQMETIAGGDWTDKLQDWINWGSDKIEKAAPIVQKAASFAKGMSDRPLNPNELHQQFEEKIYKDI